MRKRYIDSLFKQTETAHSLPLVCHLKYKSTLSPTIWHFPWHTRRDGRMMGRQIINSKTRKWQGTARVRWKRNFIKFLVRYRNVCRKLNWWRCRTEPVLELCLSIVGGWTQRAMFYSQILWKPIYLPVGTASFGLADTNRAFMLHTRTHLHTPSNRHQL